jgi:hypothetical protein
MTRRFELGPILVAIASVALIVSLFLDWFAGATAWDVFEIVDVALAALAVAALVAVVGALAPELGYGDRRWLPGIVAAVAILVAASIIDPPPVAAGRDPRTGAWIAFGAAALMVVGAVLSLGRLSFSVAVEGREPRQRVAAVDERQPTTETAALPADRPGRARVAPGEADAAPGSGRSDAADGT